MNNEHQQQTELVSFLHVNQLHSKFNRQLR